MVDPTDDKTFFTTTAWAGQNLGSGGYGWLQSWALVSPSSYTPPRPSFVGYQNAEAECPVPNRVCSVSISAPANVQKGDMLYAVFDAALISSYDQPPPAGWTPIPFLNLTTGKYQFFTTAYDSCGGWEDQAIYVHKFGSINPDPGVYTFSVTVPKQKVCGGTAWGETNVFMTGYRNACQTPLTPYPATNPHQVLSAFPSSSTTGGANTYSVSAPDNNVLQIIFGGWQDETNEAHACHNFDTPNGSPALTLEMPLSTCGDFQPYLTGDVFTGSGGLFGGYEDGLVAGGQSRTVGWTNLIPAY